MLGHRFVASGNIHEVKKFIKSGKEFLEMSDPMDRTALHFAAAHGQKEVLSLILQTHCAVDPRDDQGATPLIKAVQLKEEPCADLLLRSGADPNLADIHGNTPLHYSVYNGDSEIAMTLLTNKANIEAKNENAMTPLLLALKQKQLEMVEFLLENGADVHTRDFLGRTTLMYAVRCGSGIAISELLKRGVDAKEKDGFGWSAKRYAIASNSKIANLIPDDEEEEGTKSQGNSVLFPEPVIKEPSEKQPEESVKPEASVHEKTLKSFPKECVNSSPGSSGKNDKTKGRVLARVEKQHPPEPKPTAKEPSSDEVEITMVPIFISDCHAEIVREVSTDEDEEKAESEENVSKRNIPEPVLQKKEEVHFAGAMVERTDTMASSIMKGVFVPNTFMEDLTKEQDTKACSSNIFNYMLMKTLGRGSYATVKLAYHIPTRNSVAVKIMRKTKENAVFIENEIEIMRGLSHPNIINLFDVVEMRDHTYLVMELASQGALMKRIAEWGPVPEQETRRLFMQVLRAVQYCHSNSIAHMDIKASNILIDGRGNAKLADFGLAFNVQHGGMLVGFRGTLPYCAPEVFGDEPYCGYPADIWSLGVLLFFMVTADYPFGSSRKEVRWKVLAGNFIIPVSVSMDIFNALMEILRRDPDGRPTVHQILEFRMFRDCEAYSRPTQTLAGKPSPSIVTAVESMDYEPGEIRESLRDQQYGHELPCGDCCEHQAESHGFSVPQRTASEPAWPTCNWPPEAQEEEEETEAWQYFTRHSAPAILCCQPKGTHHLSHWSSSALPIGSSLHTRNGTEIGRSGGLSDGSQPSSPLPPVVAPGGSFVGEISKDESTAGHPQDTTTPSLPSPPHRRWGWKRVKRAIITRLRSLCCFCCLPSRTRSSTSCDNQAAKNADSGVGHRSSAERENPQVHGS